MAAVRDAMSGRDVLKNCPEDRWAWVEIDLGALRANVRTFKALLEPRTKLMCAVKADAYRQTLCVGLTSKKGGLSTKKTSSVTSQPFTAGRQCRKIVLSLPVALIRSPLTCHGVSSRTRVSFYLLRQGRIRHKRRRR